MVACGGQRTRATTDSASRRSYSSSTGKGYVLVAFVTSSFACYLYLKGELPRQIRAAQIHSNHYSLFLHQVTMSGLIAGYDIDVIFQKVSLPVTGPFKLPGYGPMD